MAGTSVLFHSTVCDVHDCETIPDVVLLACIRKDRHIGRTWGQLPTFECKFPCLSKICSNLKRVVDQKLFCSI